MASPAVSVVIPARDAASTLPAALRAIAAQDLDGAWEVVVVDDGSTDDTAALAEAAGARVVTVAPPGGGPAAARNAGAAVALAPVLAFTDADCAPAPGWLRAGLGALRDADLVQGAVAPDPAAVRGPFDRSVSVSALSGLFETANLLVDRAWFERLGGFESWLGTATAKELGEDTWLGWRAVRAGARVVFSPDALVHHAVFPRGAGAYVAERARLRFFPALAGRVPELRDSLFHRRLFLSARQARFDLAVAAVAVRRPALALPYAALVARDARARGARVAAVEVVADAVSLAALTAGSVRARSPLF